MRAAKIAEPISGNKPYQQRARNALPLLVRQAEAGESITYSDLAEELGMPNPRNLDYVLGSIGRTMERLSKAWKQKVPPIQCLVKNKNTGLPGEGIGWFLIKKEDFSKLPMRRRRAIVNAELQHVYSFPRWRDVLEALALTPDTNDFSSEVTRASSNGRGGGEGDQHIALKNYVADNPAVVGLSAITPVGETEFPLPSGDFLDVSFEGRRAWVAVEVKSKTSDESDITRGLFQCVKYRAVMDAVLLAQSKSKDARAVLVLESTLPKVLIPLRNLLGVEVIQRVTPPAKYRRK